MEEIKITLIQSELIWENNDRNLDNFNKKLKYIKDETDIILLPEMFNTGFTMNPAKCAENEDGKTIRWLKEKAKEKNCVICGSLIVKENGNFYNRLIWMQKDGVYSKYDKRHLFRLGKENEYYTAGKGAIITEIRGWKVKPLVCYDLRFPVWSMNKLISEGDDKKSATGRSQVYEYDCLIYVSNWPRSRAYAWKSLLIARAIENQSYVIGVNRIGKDGNGVSHAGGSLAVNYKGEIMAEFPADMEYIRTVKLSYNELLEYRKKFAFALDWDKFEISNE